VVLSFVGSLTDPRAIAEVADLVQLSASSTKMTSSSAASSPAASRERPSGQNFGPTLSFLAIMTAPSPDRSAQTARRAPSCLLRAIADIAWTTRKGHAHMVRNDPARVAGGREFRGRADVAPALMVRAYFLRFATSEAVPWDAGRGRFRFSVRRRWQDVTLSDWRLKRRATLRSALAKVRETDPITCAAAGRPARAVFPVQGDRMDRYVVACYDSAVSAHFHRHRDNINAKARIGASRSRSI